ncbi:hypothetical protein YC2023_050920 [Brassica napus]
MTQDIARIQRSTDVSRSTSIDRHRQASIDRHRSTVAYMHRSTTAMPLGHGLTMP